MRSLWCESKVIKEHRLKIEVSMSQHRYTKQIPPTEEGTVYPRVHYCIHACTQVRSKYLLYRARLYVCFLGIIRRIPRDELRGPRICNDAPKIQRLEYAREIMRRPRGAEPLAWYTSKLLYLCTRK